MMELNAISYSQICVIVHILTEIWYFSFDPECTTSFIDGKCTFHARDGSRMDEGNKQDSLRIVNAITVGASDRKRTCLVCEVGIGSTAAMKRIDSATLTFRIYFD